MSVFIFALTQRIAIFTGCLQKMGELDAYLNKVLNDLSALPEEKMRLALLARRLTPLTPEEAAMFFSILYNKGAADSAARKARGMLVNPEGLHNAIGVETCKRIYMASIRLGLGKISRLFTDLPPHKKGLSGYEEEEDAPMEHVPLGTRRSMSKTNAKNVLDRLLSDPDPLVISNILDNPRITEREVLKIASKRPNSARIIKLVSSHKKWSKRYAVMSAVARNPYTPPRISIALLELMFMQDLKKIARDTTIHPQVKMSAKDLIEERNEDKEDGGD